MKKMTCYQLGGACEEEFHADSFEEMSSLSQKHGAEMFKKGDEDHLRAQNQMMELMKEPEKMQSWMEEKKNEFEALPEID